MICTRKPIQGSISGQVSSVLLSLMFVTTPPRAIAHAGHGDGAFQGGQAAQSTSAIQVDEETARRIGLKVEAVTPKRLMFGVKATGQIEALPSKKVAVTNPVGGTVVRLYVQPGDLVTAGQPIALISSPILAELRVGSLEKRAEASGNVQQAQADLQLAQDNYSKQQRLAAAEIQQAKTALDFAQDRYDKDRELLASGAIPRRTVLESETKLAEAKAVFVKAQNRLQVAEATAQLKRARSQVQVARSRIDLSNAAYNARLNQLGATPNPDGTVTVTAPIAGTVADREVTLGQSVEDAGDSKLMTIVDGRRVLATANIFEKDLQQVSPGQPVRVSVNGLPDRIFAGRISVVGSVVEGDSRVVPVKAELDNSTGVLKPGMFAQLELLKQTPVTGLAIPQAAIVEANGRTLVYVQNGQNFEPVDVMLGRRAGTLVEIKTGLFDGDRVVVQGAPMLYAQSLRGGKKTAADSGEATTTAATHPSLPWWTVALVAAAIAAGTFWAGMVWATYRSRKAEGAIANPAAQEHPLHPISTETTAYPSPAETASHYQPDPESTVPPR